MQSLLPFGRKMSSCFWENKVSSRLTVTWEVRSATLTISPSPIHALYFFCQLFLLSTTSNRNECCFQFGLAVPAVSSPSLLCPWQDSMRNRPCCCVSIVQQELKLVCYQLNEIKQKIHYPHQAVILLAAVLENHFFSSCK